MIHVDTHNSDKSHNCTMCVFKTKVQYELYNHVLQAHGIENEDTTHENLSSLGGTQPQDKSQIETNKNVITPGCAGAKEKTYLCPTCDFRCSSNAAMKSHMQTHNIPDIYMICDEDYCNFECESKEKLQDHKTEHMHPKNKYYSYTDILKQPVTNTQDQNRYDWSEPFKNGKPLKSKTHNQFSPGQHSSVTNNTHDYHNSHRDNPGLPRQQSRAKSNAIKGSNSNSALAVAPRPHLAKVFASGFSPGTNPNNIKKDLEENIFKLTGKSYAIKIEKLQTRFDTYSSFKISCHCTDSNIFMNSQIWPANVLIKWFKERRTPMNGPDSRSY